MLPLEIPDKNGQWSVHLGIITQKLAHRNKRCHLEIFSLRDAHSKCPLKWITLYITGYFTVHFKYLKWTLELLWALWFVISFLDSLFGFGFNTIQFNSISPQNIILIFWPTKIISQNEWMLNVEMIMMWWSKLIRIPILDFFAIQKNYLQNLNSHFKKKIILIKFEIMKNTN